MQMKNENVKITKLGAVPGLCGSDPDIWTALQDLQQHESLCMGRAQGLPGAKQR